MLSEFARENDEKIEEIRRDGKRTREIVEDIKEQRKAILHALPLGILI